MVEEKEKEESKAIDILSLGTKRCKEATKLGKGLVEKLVIGTVRKDTNEGGEGEFRLLRIPEEDTTTEKEISDQG